MPLWRPYGAQEDTEPLYPEQPLYVAAPQAPGRTVANPLAIVKKPKEHGEIPSPKERTQISRVEGQSPLTHEGAVPWECCCVSSLEDSYICF